MFFGRNVHDTCAAGSIFVARTFAFVTGKDRGLVSVLATAFIGELTLVVLPGLCRWAYQRETSHQVHPALLRYAWRYGNTRDVVSQLARLIGAALFTWAWVPESIAGGTNIGAFARPPLMLGSVVGNFGI